jgi:hypothetical protein
MTAMRIVLLVLSLAVVGFVAKYALTGTVTGDPPGKTEPARQLDNVRERAKELEGELQRGADRADQAAEQTP